MKIKLLIFFLMSATNIYAQIKIKGEVQDSSNNGVGFANIIITTVSEPSKTVGFTTCDENGKFIIDGINEKEIDLEISAIGYKRKNIRLKTNQSNVKIKLEEEYFELKEFTVVAKEYQDTVNLKTDKMNLTQNSTLREILVKSNEFEVSDNGAIIVDGKPVTKILINKKEVFINQNSIALDNVTNDMIKNVQLINNYKDKFSIDFDDRKTSVINIETKDSFKGVAKSNAEVGYGYKEKYLLKGKAMFFSDKFNSFLTQNTNNIISRDFNYENLSESYKNINSSIFNNAINPFIDKNKSINKDFSSGSSFIIRKEFSKFKISSVLYYNHLNQTINFLTNRKSQTDNINDEINANNLKSNFTSFNFSSNYFLSKNTILLFDVRLGAVDKKNNAKNQQQNYFPISTLLSENLDENSKSLVLANDITLSKLINTNLIFTSNLSIDDEKSTNKISSLLTNSLNGINAINQDFNLKSNHFYGETKLEYSFSRLLNITSGINYSYARENLQNKVLQNESQWITRKDKYIGLPVVIQGANDKLRYFLKITPTIRNLEINDTETRQYIPAAASLYYEISRKKSINLFYENKYQNNDILRTIDTTYTNYNNRVISDKYYNLRLNQNQSVGSKYIYNNSLKTQYFSVAVGYNQSSNSLRNIFSNFDKNIIYYRTINLRKQSSVFTEMQARKGYYFSEQSHKIVFGTSLNYTQSYSLTSYQNQLVPLKINSFSPEFTISLVPQKTFFKEFNISVSANNNLTFFGNNLVNTEKNINSYAELIGEGQRFFYAVKYYYNILMNQNQKFYRKDIDFNLKYKLNENLYLTCQSNSLLNLLNITNNNISDLSISTNEGIITTVVNPSILGYLITGIQIKF